MAVHLPCFQAIVAPSLKRGVSQPPPFRAQSFREEEGRSSASNPVYANLSVLRKRIDEAKTKERLERCRRSELASASSDGTTPRPDAIPYPRGEQTRRGWSSLNSYF